MTPVGEPKEDLKEGPTRYWEELPDGFVSGTYATRGHQWFVCNRMPVTLQFMGKIRNGKREGVWRFYLGKKLWRYGRYVGGEKEGVWWRWPFRINGTTSPRSQKMYKEGRLHGPCQVWEAVPSFRAYADGKADNAPFVEVCFPWQCPVSLNHAPDCKDPVWFDPDWDNNNIYVQVDYEA